MATEDLMEVINANNRFANNCYKILSNEIEGNVFFSPLSIHTVLSMVYQGAAEETAKVLAKTLGVPNKEFTANRYNKLLNILNNIPKVTLHFANKIYIKEGPPLKNEFEKATKGLFLSETESINFEDNERAAKNINSWVQDKTNQKIKEIIVPEVLDQYSRLILLNAIYFKGNWNQQFPEKYTKTEPFYLTSIDKMDCQMMHISEYYYYRKDEHLDAQILEMKYANRDISMVVILPNKIDGIHDLENKLVETNLSTIAQGVYHTEVNLSLPKFKIKTGMELKFLLEKMGLGIIFDDKKANFSEISETDEQLYVSTLIHKAFIEVNEEGTEAVAVTEMLMEIPECSVYEPPKPIPFIVDHPFIILLQVQYKDSRTTLFYGRIGEPIIRKDN
ncbi:hypothetical protein ILUMI_17830 [Ignelater luminosus]|uniref:Serpin domain-containing protein n=1 Tax=Ignelater luminosus TaxID=2038154 RepID=A0A8K0G4Q0_IGNLU|nr:hypothetical protein ILUMI_17830 [Ignelater luminosus]